MDFLLDQNILWALKVLIKAFKMVRDYGLMLESFRGTKIKILETDFQKMWSAKLLNFQYYAKSHSNEVVNKAS